MLASRVLSPGHAAVPPTQDTGSAAQRIRVVFSFLSGSSKAGSQAGLVKRFLVTPLMPGALGASVTKEGNLQQNKAALPRSVSKIREGGGNPAPGQLPSDFTSKSSFISRAV